MRKVPLEEARDYLGKTVATPVFFKGFILVEKGAPLTGDLIDRLEEIKDQIPHLFLDLEPDIRVKEVFDGEEYTRFQKKIEKTVQSFIFGSAEDVSAITEVMNSILTPLFADPVMKDLNLDAVLLHQQDVYTHSLNVAILSALMAIKSGKFQRQIVEEITQGALLHDIGRAKIQAEQEKSWDALSRPVKQTHPVVGYEMLRDIPQIPESVKKIVLLHHVWEDPEESFDATAGDFASYPYEYNGTKVAGVVKGLPISIVQVADTFEIMTNNSARSVPKRRAIDAIVKQAERVYGEGAILLAKYIAPYGIGDTVNLSNGTKAVVLSQTQNNYRPVVRIVEGKTQGSVVDLSKKIFLKILD